MVSWSNHGCCDRIADSRARLEGLIGITLDQLLVRKVKPVQEFPKPTQQPQLQCQQLHVLLPPQIHLSMWLRLPKIATPLMAQKSWSKRRCSSPIRK